MKLRKSFYLPFWSLSVFVNRNVVKKNSGKVFEKSCGLCRDKKRSKELRSRPNTNWRSNGRSVRVVCSETGLRIDETLFGTPAMRCLRRDGAAAALLPHPHMTVNHHDWTVRTRNSYPLSLHSAVDQKTVKLFYL